MDKYQFYLELARLSPGEVLKLACGTGLTTIPLSKAGITMTGVDISSAMLAYTRLKAEGLTVTLMEGDARTFESDKRIRPLMELETILPFYDFHDAFSAVVWCKNRGIEKNKAFLKESISVLQKSVGC